MQLPAPSNAAMVTLPVLSPCSPRTPPGTPPSHNQETKKIRKQIETFSELKETIAKEKPTFDDLLEMVKNSKMSQNKDYDENEEEDYSNLELDYVEEEEED